MWFSRLALEITKSGESAIQIVDPRWLAKVVIHPPRDIFRDHPPWQWEGLPSSKIGILVENKIETTGVARTVYVPARRRSPAFLRLWLCSTGAICSRPVASRQSFASGCPIEGLSHPDRQSIRPSSAHRLLRAVLSRTSKIVSTFFSNPR